MRSSRRIPQPAGVFWMLLAGGGLMTSQSLKRKKAEAMARATRRGEVRKGIGNAMRVMA